jgi:UDP-N-acetylglucosamine pyrophosphorylase
LGWKLLQAGNLPVWVMTSFPTTQEIQRHISQLALPLGMNGCIFEQFLGYCLTPDNRLLLVDGVPQLYPLGHGDVGPALIESGVLDDNPTVKYVYVCNVDNVLGSPHPGIIGRHIRRGRKVTCEVVEREKGDRGGCVAWVNNQLQIAEDFRLPSGFAEEAKYLNTNTFLIDVEVLRWPIPWRWHRVRKQVDNQIFVQYERLIQQYTEECETDFLVVPRETRYCAVKVPEDLERADKVISSYRFA